MNAGPRALRVLVIEDNRDTVASLKTLLEAAGFEVKHAYGGVEGIELSRKFIPDAVLCDIGLPGVDGYYVARAIRHDPAQAHVKLIAVTAYGSEEDRSRALAAGFDHHVVKPADPVMLVDLLLHAGSQH